MALAFCTGLIACRPTSFAQYAGTNGIFAEFNTSMGSYTCVLYYAQAPKAVANFIGLATGQRAWLDLPSGVVKTNPFYNGITYHRVITNFMNQCGSRNGLGTDGPGYAFQDEITNTLQFDKFGVLAMANSGPDSNGSQFFILATSNLPSLNNNYTVFGQLFGGSNTVYAINRTPTKVNPNNGVYEIPITPVTLNSVKIVTNGTAAATFYTNIHSQGLPLVTNLNLAITKTGNNVSLNFSNRLYSEVRIYSSSNLLNWSASSLGLDNSLPLLSSNLQAVGSSPGFFRAAQIKYPTNTGPHRVWFGKTLALFYTNGVSGTNVINFNSSGGGTYNYAASPTGTVLGYNWNQTPLPFDGNFVPMGFSALPDHAIGLHWKNSTSGYFTGFYYSFGYPFGANPISGTFTNSP
ncbi:MAG: peptidylprolyl isomerase [Verrucomicrobiota bacterium]